MIPSLKIMKFSPCGSGVEHSLGKAGVVSSSLTMGAILETFQHNIPIGIEFFSFLVYQVRYQVKNKFGFDTEQLEVALWQNACLKFSGYES